MIWWRFSTLPHFGRTTIQIRLPTAWLRLSSPCVDADFIYVLIPDRQGEPLVEVLRASKTLASKSLAPIRAALHDALPSRASSAAINDRQPKRARRAAFGVRPLGFGADDVIVAGSGRPDFPTEAQLLLLKIAANETTIASQRWQVDAQKHRFVSLIERSSDFVGIASFDGRPQYINPAGLNHIGLSGMKQASLPSIFDFVIPEERPRARSEIWPIVMQVGRWCGEIKFRHCQTEAATPFLVDCFRIDDPRTGRPMNIATVGRDITAQKRSEAQLLNLAEMLEQRVADRTAELAEANRKTDRRDRRARACGRASATIAIGILPCRAFECGRANGGRPGARA